MHALIEPMRATALALRVGRSAGNISDQLAVIGGSGLITRARRTRHVIYSRTPLAEHLPSGAVDDVRANQTITGLTQRAAGE